MKYELNEEKILCNMKPKKCNSLIWISLLQCFLSSSKLYNQIGEHYWRVYHSLQSCHTVQKLDRREYRARYEPRLAPKMNHPYITSAHIWTFYDPPTMIVSINTVKFIYSEKATKFCETFTLLLSTLCTYRP